MKNLAGLVLRTLTVFLVFVLGGVSQYRYQLVEKGLSLSKEDKKPSSPQVIDTKNIEMGHFWEAWSYLQSEYLKQDDIKTQGMVDGAVKGMVASLGDPYTMYLSPEDNKRSGEDLAGAFYGVGIELGYKDGVLAVMAPLPGSPAEEAGIKAGDLILRVKDETSGFDQETTNWSLQEAVGHIRGPKDSVVTLTLYRDSNGQKPFETSVKRGEILVNSVELKILESQDGKFAHLKLIRFGERTMEEWNTAVEQILSQKESLDGVLLDMRNDPGGFFDVAIDVASDFIEKGVVVTQKGKFTSKEYQARGKARLAGVKTVVLVNQGSASAAEIVAGALRDQLGFKLVGEKTFGKGTVQDRKELTNGGGLHITIARWLLPGGDWINEEGLTVDFEIKDNEQTETDEILDKGKEVLRSINF